MRPWPNQSAAAPLKASPQGHIQYHKDGSVWAKGPTAKGVPVGYWEWFRKDGTKLRSGHFEHGGQAGEWTTYDRQGQVYKVTQMKPKAKLPPNRRSPRSADALVRVAARRSQLADEGIRAPRARVPAAAGKPRTIAAYLAALPADKRAALERLRKTIRAVAPKAEECLSYGVPAFRLDGRMLVGFGATAKHCALFLMSGTTVAAHAAELVGHDTSKGTVRFPADQPLPAALVRKLVKARIAENRRMTGER